MEEVDSPGGLPPVPYQLHDSTLQRALLRPDGTLTLIIHLYSILYPGGPTVTLRFTGVRDPASVHRWIADLELEEEDGRSIEAFHYDIKRPSQPGELFFFLKVDGGRHTRIHCRALRVEETGG